MNGLGLGYGFGYSFGFGYGFGFGFGFGFGSGFVYVPGACGKAARALVLVASTARAPACRAAR